MSHFSNSNTHPNNSNHLQSNTNLSPLKFPSEAQYQLLQQQGYNKKKGCNCGKIK
ncbi:hypothetical protein [Bacillus cereus]|uniref:hypothetical protein n=1 Tax=Bacillus cereus TaxID=1396 RepID=UPI0015910A84|nr:hypothetical protein [Bacillus cereus]